MNTFTARIRRAPYGPFGDRTSPSYHDIPGCIRWPRSSVEVTDRSSSVLTGYTLVAPIGSDLRSTDDVQFPDDPADVWWSVDGEALPYESPFTGWTPGIVAALTRASG